MESRAQTGVVRHACENGAYEPGKYFCRLIELSMSRRWSFPPYTQPSHWKVPGGRGKFYSNLDVFTPDLTSGATALGFITLSIIWWIWEIPGLGLWWSQPLAALAAVNSSSCRFAPPYQDLAGQPLITFCLALMPLAIQRFFGEPPNWRAFTLFMLVYLLILCWSVIFNDKMAPGCCWPA